MEEKSRNYSDLTPSQLLDLAYVFSNKAEAMEENYNSPGRRNSSEPHEKRI